jgi:hypothetical protein
MCFYLLGCKIVHTMYLHLREYEPSEAGMV